jgi:DNA-binding transcriptional MerR regulator
VLTISQLAAYAGVTVRAVRHYHAKGLLPEPERDHSGYRRYDAAAVVELVRIRTLAEAGVPLSRVRELLAADDREFAVAVRQVDQRLRAEIRERRRHRARIAELASGESLALPTEVTAYLDRMRELGFLQRLIEVERDSWILIAAQMPDQVPALMAIKQAQIEHEGLRALYLDLGDLVDCAPDDPRLPELADRVAAFIEALAARSERPQSQQALDPQPQSAQPHDEQPPDEYAISADLVALLDTTFVESFPCATRLLELLQERGWTGWTDIRRIDVPTTGAPTTGGGNRAR